MRLNKESAKIDKLEESLKTLKELVLDENDLLSHLNSAIKKVEKEIEWRKLIINESNKY